MNDGGLDATIDPTSITLEGVSCLVTVAGTQRSIRTLSELVRKLEVAAPDEVRLLVAEDTRLAYFGYCRTPPDGRLQLAQLAQAHLGPRISYTARITRGNFVATIKAPVNSQLDPFYHRARAQLEPTFKVGLDRLGPATSGGGRPLRSLQDERILLEALNMGYFDQERGGSIRDLSALVSRGKSRTEATLRRAVAHLVDDHLNALADPPLHPTGSFEYWGGTPRSAHYEKLLSTPSLTARVESVNVQRDTAWQIVIAEGPQDEINRLREIVEREPAPPIEAMEVLHHAPELLVYYDRWKRPSDAAVGVSLEHILYDHCGHAGRMAIEFRHQTGRVTAIGTQPCIAHFLNDALLQLGQRFNAEILSPPDATLADSADTRILRTARELGYFAIPRVNGLIKVGRAADVSASTAGLVIRRALRNAIFLHVQGARRARDDRDASDADAEAP